MILYLLRHAEAEAIASSDAVRKLTSKGETQARRIGTFCVEQGIVPDIILTSPVERARRTAEYVARELSSSPLLEVPWAACGMSEFEALEELGAYGKFQSIMLVGHQPDLGFLMVRLLGASDASAFRVRKALLAGIEFESGIAEGRGELQFFLPVKLL